LSLKRANGQIAQTDQALKAKIQGFYSTLYTSDFAIAADLMGRHEVLALVAKVLSEKENNCISTMPANEEIEQVVFDIKHNVSLGIDGITANAVRLCWHYMGGVCIKGVQAFWSNFILSLLDSGNIIKLLKKVAKGI
jgi:hypothetical protein